jgi:hypothetical protein
MAKKLVMEEMALTGVNVPSEKLLKDVVILGDEARNGRHYPAVVRKAAVKNKVYEGVPVYVSHPKQPSPGTRSVIRDAQDRLGAFQNVRLGKGDLVIGDLAYLDSHPMTGRVMESVERKLNFFQMSHVAVIDDSVMKDGIEEVTSFGRVFEVDLVGQGATTSQLVLEGEEVMYAPVEDPTESDMHADEALLSSVTAIIKDEALDLAGKKEKILAALDAHYEVHGKEEEEEEEAAAEEDPKAEAVEIDLLKAKMEALERQLTKKKNAKTEPVTSRTLVNSKQETTAQEATAIPADKTKLFDWLTGRA